VCRGEGAAAGAAVLFWGVLSGLRRRQQNLAFKAWMLPLTEERFIVSKAEAAKSCFQGVDAAFDRREIHRVEGGGSKNLLSEGCLLPLTKEIFIVSKAEAAKTCFQRHICCL